MQVLTRNQKWSVLLALLGALSADPDPVRAEAAVAFGQSPSGWADGTGFNYQTQNEAQNAAMERCNERGQNCIIIASFQNQCFALAVQNGGNGYSWKTHDNQAQAEREAVRNCAAMGRRCAVRESFCDSVKEEIKTEVCMQPIFQEEMRLRVQVAEDPSKVEQNAAAVTYLKKKYCRTIIGAPTSDQSTHIGDNCFQYTGIFRNERVYWGECLE